MGEIEPQALSQLATKAFVLVTPLRPLGYWWTIEGDSDWSYVDGLFQHEKAEELAEWLQELAQDPAIDSERVSLLGFSAGAYAITELLATCLFRPFVAVLGGVHGHGQPDMKNIVGKRKAKEEEILEKWDAYIERVRHHGGATGGILGAHNQGDAHSSHEYAQHIYNALIEGQEEHQLEARVKCELVPLDCESKKKGGRCSHNYIKNTFHRKELVDYLLGSPLAAARAPAEPTACPAPPLPVHARQRAEPRGTAGATASRGAPHSASTARSRSRARAMREDDFQPDQGGQMSPGRSTPGEGGSRDSSVDRGSDAGRREKAPCGAGSLAWRVGGVGRPATLRGSVQAVVSDLGSGAGVIGRRGRARAAPAAAGASATIVSDSERGAASEAEAEAEVICISGRGDWNVDAVELALADGVAHSYGKSHDGEALPVWEQAGSGNILLAPEPRRDEAGSWRRSSGQAARLDTGETVIKVGQLNSQVGHLGARLIFTTSSDRTIVIEGRYGTNKYKQWEEFEAPPGCQVRELVFEDSRLADIVAS